MTKARSSSRRTYATRRYETASAALFGQVRARWLPKSRSRGAFPRLRVGAIVLIALVAATVVWMTLDDRFYIRTANVVGASRMSPDAVFRASGLPGLHILWADHAKAEAGIEETLRGIKHAEVGCRLPAQCTIRITERQPQVMWKDGTGVWWIDEDGVILPAQGLLSEGWLVQGPLPRNEDGRLHERARATLAELQLLGLSVSAPLRYDPARGFVFVDSRGWQVIVGDGPGAAERLRVLEWVAADLEARQVTPRFVDVRFPGAPYYSLTNDW